MLIGSGVSAYQGLDLPTADAVKTLVIEGLGSLLHHCAESPGVDPRFRRICRTSAEYAEELISGAYSGLLRAIKFEEFLWYVEQTVGQSNRFDLLRVLYACEHDDYSLNHVAVSGLLEVGKVGICLTTNFDNALERAAFPARLHVMDYSGLAKIDPRPHGPTLVKLHGDAEERTGLATSPELFASAKEGRFSPLQPLLAGQTVLVAGYSGRGDIDIFPILERAKAEYIWLVRRHETPPKIAHYKFTTDLASREPNENCLLWLAERVGIHADASPPPRDRKSEIAKWSRATFSQATAIDLLRLMFAWRSGWPALHLYALQSMTIEGPIDVSTRLGLGRALLQVSCYRSAVRVVDDVDPARDPNSVDAMALRVIKGFALWRQGRFDSARLGLSDLIKLTSLPDIDREVAEQLARALRNYMEICRDRLRSTPKHRRSELARSWQLQAVADWLEDHPSANAVTQLLQEAVVLDLDQLLGKPVNIERLQAKFITCMDSRYYPEAEAFARILFMVSPIKGLRRLLEADRRLAQLGMWNTVANSIIVVLDRILPNAAARAIYATALRIRVEVAELKYRILRWRWST